MRALAAQGIPVPWTLLLVEDESVIGRAFYLMQHVEGRIFWDQSLPGAVRGDRAAIYDEMNRVIARLHTVDIERAGLSDYGKAGNYFAASDRTLEQAVPRLRDRARRRDGSPDRMAAGAHPRRRRDHSGAWRLPHGQPDLPPDRTSHRRDPRLGTVHARASARRFFLPLHELAHPARRLPRHRRPRPRCARHSRRSRVHPPVRRAHRARRRSRTGTSTSPTTCSGSPPSCRASTSARPKVLRRRTTRCRHGRTHAHWPIWAGATPQRA